MSILHPIIAVFKWLFKSNSSPIKNIASIAVVITEAVKLILSNPVTKLIENILSAVTHTELPTQIVDVINKEIPNILAVELAIEGLPNNPTEEQVLAFEQSILKAFDVKSDNSKLYTILSAQVYGIIKRTQTSTPGKFYDWINAVQEAYVDYKKDINIETNKSQLLDRSVTIDIPIY